MKESQPGRSLFWAFAGVFTAVLVAATALQMVLSIAVMRPLALESDRARARRALARAARELAELPEAHDPLDVVDVLQANRIEGGGALLIYLPRAGRWIPERVLPPPLMRQIQALAASAAITPRNPAPEAFAPPDDPRAFSGPPGGPAAGGGRFGDGPPDGGRFGDGPPDGGRFGEGPPGGGPPPGRMGGPPPSREQAPPFEPRGLELVLLARQDVLRAGSPLGTLIAVGRAPTSSLWSSPESRALLLFMPFAVIAAGIAALLMVRIMARRLGALEQVAARVTGGDLAARVAATGQDEIGRLERGINRMTERLEAARDQVAETDRQRRRLLADITHELATPLTSIRGYLETLLNPDVPLSPDEPRQYLRDALAESERMDLLIRDLIDLARLEAGAQPLARERLDWTALCRNTVRRFEPRFRAARLRLEWAGDPGESWISADGRRMEQLVENLLGNALRYVPAGGTVRLELAWLDGGGRFRLSVRDDGPGIPPEDLPQVFDRFYRARNVRDSGGSGLGLAIVREIVERHGGEVRAERGEPRGAVFTVEMPGA
jgi:two-component system sensor histidine kinase BaeS